jgi:hypothetical protein
MTEHGSPQVEQAAEQDPSPTNKAQKQHDNSTPSREPVDLPTQRLVKVGPPAARVASRSSRIPPVAMDSIIRIQSIPDPLDQINDAVYMYASESTPAAMPYSPSLIGFGGLSLASPAPGNALGLITDSPAERPPLPSFREALAMSRHASDADISSLPFGTTSFDSRSTLVSNTSFDNLYSPNMQDYHGSSSICFPPLPTPPSLWSNLARRNKELPDPYSEQFADADEEPDTELHRQTLSELRRGSTSHMPGPSNLFNQGRVDPHSQTMPQMGHSELPRVRSPSFKGDAFVFPAPPKTLPGQVNAPTPPPTYPPPLLPANYSARVNEPTAGPSSSKLSAGLGRFWKLGFKTNEKKSSRLLPLVDELNTLAPPCETSPETSLRVVDESIFDFTRYAADEDEAGAQAFDDALEDSVEVEVEEEEEITIDSLERMAGPFDQQEITLDSLQGLAGSYEEEEDDEDYDNVSEDDFPGCSTFQLRQRTDPGYPTEGDWNDESERWAMNKALKAAAGPNPAQIALQELDGKVLHPEFMAKYHVLQELGSGGFGFVCVAMNQEGREVAVKFIRKIRDPAVYPLAMAGDEPMECFVLRSINHPNVVGYVEQFEDEQFYYLVSPAGSTLGRRLIFRCKSYMVIRGIGPDRPLVTKRKRILHPCRMPRFTLPHANS